MSRYYVLVRLKDSSHVEAEFNTEEEVREFFDKYKDKIIAHESIVEDRKKIQKTRNQETLGWMAMIALGLFTLYFTFK